MKSNYGANDIQVLSDLQHMRARKGVYIGESKNPSQLISEIFDNAMDEVQGGFSTELIVSVNTKTNEYSVRDFGRGIPHGKKKLENGHEKEVLEVLLTKANSGGKFNNDNYAFSSGLNGLGLTITNALSNYIEITSYRDGKFVKATAKCSDKVKLEYGTSSEHSGTLVRFQPDPTMFESKEIPVEFIEGRCKIASALGFKARLIVDDKEKKISSDIFALIREEDKSISKYADVPEIEVVAANKEKMKVAIRYTSDTSDKYFGYTNLLSNYLGGTHVQELAKTIKCAWREFLTAHKSLQPATELKDNDFLLGSRSVCAVFIAKPEFSSQTKEKLVVNKSYFDELMTKFKKQFIKYLDGNLVLAQQLLKRFEEYRIAQNSLLSRKEISSIIKVNTDSDDNIRRRSVVSKLKECTSRKRDGTELFLVEGDSACLRWDTKIRLANNTDATIKEVCERIHNGELIYVYGRESEENQTLGPNVYRVLSGGITRHNALLYRVCFDNDTYVDCTGDHRFLLVDGTYKEAKDLTPSDSLMVLHKGMEDYHYGACHDKIYHQIYLKYYPGEIIPEHYHVHHKDWCHFNNYPNNLEVLPPAEHTRLHNAKNDNWNAHVGDVTPLLNHWKSAENRDAQSMRTTKYFELEDNRLKTPLATKAGMAKMTKEQHQKRIRLQRYNVSLAYYKDIIMYRQIATIDTLFDKSVFAEIKKHDGLRHSPLHLCASTFMRNYDIKTIDELERLIQSANHRITSVECLNIYEDVYDIEVEESHNFCLSNDVIVHNCGPYMSTRNKETQAVLPLRGKILNVTNRSIKEAIKNNEICDIANAIGAGIGTACDASKSRYDRIILSADADDDGLQINCLLLSMFVNLFPDMIKQGKVFITVPPLYCWGTDAKSYAWTNDINKVPENAKNMHRFKGLGEMNTDQLEFFLVNPKTRNMFQVEYPSDVDEFNRIMGTSEGKNNLYKDLGIIEE